MPYADPERRRAYHARKSAEWARENRDKYLAQQRAYDQRRASTPNRISQNAAATKRKRVRQRLAVIERYGGQCAFCGSDQYEYLTMDHVNGNGNAHRAQLPDSLVAFLYASDFRPDLYRVLCWNCHMALTLFGVEPGGSPLRDADYWRSFSALRYRERRRPPTA
jgi:hypothetical protein